MAMQSNLRRASNKAVLESSPAGSREKAKEKLLKRKGNLEAKKNLIAKSNVIASKNAIVGYGDSNRKLDPMTSLDVNGALQFNSKVTIPGNPPPGSAVLYVTGAGLATDGDVTLKVTNSSGTTKSFILKDFDTGLQVSGGEGESAAVELYADEGDDNADKWRLIAVNGANLELQSYSTGSWVALASYRTDGRFTGACLKDEDDMASNSAVHIATQQSIKSYVDTNKYIVVHGGFNYGVSAGTKQWIPLAGSSTVDISGSSSSGYPEYINFIAPYDGSLEKIIFRSEEACGSTVVGFHRGTDGNEMPSTTATQSVTVDMTTDDTSYEFAFTSSNTFSKGNIIGVSFDPTNDANDVAYTVVFKMDITT